MQHAAPNDRSGPAAAATLGAMVTAACALRGARPFLTDADLRLDGPGVETATRLAAGALQRLGVARGSPVCFIARPSVAHTVAWFGAVRCGAVVTSLHLMDTPDRLAGTIDWLEASLLLCDSEFADLANRICEAAARPPRVVLLDDPKGFPAAFADPVEPLDAADPDDPVAVVLSSGSTGRPKGVVHTHRTILASCAAGPEVYRDLDDSDSVLVVIGTSFGGWANVVPPFLASGARLHFQRRFDAAAFVDGLQSERITIAPLVPTMWRMVLGALSDSDDLSAVRLAFMSGEPPEGALVEQIQARVAARVTTAYLSTEGACACGVLVHEDAFAADDAPAGRVASAAKVRIADPEDPAKGDLGPGEVGEILLSGPSLATGYWKDPTLSAERFRDGWWRSGDTGYRNEAGSLRVVGRTDHLINSGGIKVQAEEIEAALMRHPAIRQAAVAGIPDPLWGSRIEAWVVLDDANVDPGDILGWCRENEVLHAAKLPKDIHPVDSLPTGPTGKLYRRALVGGPT